MNLKNIVFSLLALIGVFIACEQKDPEVIVYEAKMTSFGFYVEDNEGLIHEDYVNSTFTGTSINLFLPEEIDKSTLIARFTVTDKDEVKVGTVSQQSGKTANDFTVPVDYIVTEGTANVKYTVTIGKAPAYVWTALASLPTDLAVSLKMNVNPVDGVPYIIYKIDKDESDDQGAALLSFKDEKWTSLGQASDGRIGSYYDLTFNSKGVPYVSYTDYTAKTSQQATVKYYTGNWNLLGSVGAASSNKVSYHGINFASDDKLLLMATYDAKDGALARREMSVNTYENGVWAHNSTIPGRSSDLVSYLNVSKKQGNAIYLGVYNAVNPNSFSVYKYENNAWSTLIDKWSDTNATGISLRDLDIAVDADGNVFVAFADNSSEQTYKHRVIKYDAVTKEISTVGNYLAGASGGLFNFDLEINPFGVLYLFYRNESLFPCVTYIDNETQDWTQPHIFEPAEADDLDLSFTPTGIGYAVYTKDNKIFGYKYSAPVK
ncbi:hypothetical protein [Limibacterium fermenti]|uniref:hypothetical protein n=1 Tax=Limibacterium fermenti TaxID=3229863 RepID=UPI000E7E5ECB|nr:hypothetical protein [Porphyromonadaceae bacterium]